MENQFDKIMKERLQEASSSPPQDLWDKIEGKLDAFENPIEESKSIKISPIWKYAAAAAVSGIAVALGFLFLQQDSTKNQSASTNRIIRQNIEIGEKINPQIEVVNVAEVKQPQKNSGKVHSSKQNVASQKVVVEPHSISANELASATDIDNNDVPVFSLKMSSPKFSTGMNEKIKVLSGEPIRVEVDEDLNQKQIQIYQRMKINSEYNKIFKKSKNINP